MERLTEAERARLDGVLIGIATSISSEAMRVISDAIQRMYKLEMEQTVGNLSHYDKHHIAVDLVCKRTGLVECQEEYGQAVFKTTILRDDKPVALVITDRATGEVEERSL